MKKIIIYQLFLLLLSVVTKAQDTSNKVLVIPMLSVQTFLPKLGGNNFGTTYRFSGGGAVNVNLSPSFYLITGGKLGTVYTGHYGIDSRSFSYVNLHAAISLIYKKKLAKGTTVSIGPAIARISYFIGEPSPVPRGKNISFNDFSKKIRDSMPGIRGLYYNALYLYTEYKNPSFSLEANLLIPGRLPPPFYSWQPRSSLVHAIRLKSRFSFKKIGFLIDVGIPVVAQENKISYRDFTVLHTTGRAECSINLQKSEGGLIKALIGFERDWHPLNFPLLLKEDRDLGTWGSLYLGIKVESLIKKVK